MTTPTHLNILWTTGDPTTFHEMVYKYALNSRLQEWWEEVTLIIWGASTKLVEENAEVREKILELLSTGVNVTACKGCSDNLGVTPTLLELGVEVKYWGAPLTELLKADGKLLCV